MGVALMGVAGVSIAHMGVARAVMTVIMIDTVSRWVMLSAVLEWLGVVAVSVGNIALM
jgi:hypothetical protein